MNIHILVIITYLVSVECQVTDVALKSQLENMAKGLKVRTVRFGPFVYGSIR